MIEEIEIRIGDLIEISRKGNNMTLKEKQSMTTDISEFGRVDQYIANGKLVKLTPKQKEFVRKLLKTCILENISDIESILELYDLNVDSVLYHLTEPYNSFFDQGQRIM
jgi:hypothetical protein